MKGIKPNPLRCFFSILMIYRFLTDNDDYDNFDEETKVLKQRNSL